MLPEDRVMMKRKYFLFIALVFLIVLLMVGVAGCATPTKQPVTRLSTPQNIRFEGRRVYWDSVENADEYTVIVDGEEYKTSDSFFDLSFLKEVDDYVIIIMACSNDKKYKSSQWAWETYTPEEIVQEGYDESGLNFKLLKDGTGYEVFMGKYNQKGHIVIPDYFRGLPVKRIGEYAFTSKSTNLHCFTGSLCNIVTTGITLPKYLESIGRDSMSCMQVLEEIVIPDSVTEIDTGAFYGNIKMTKVVLPKNLKEIPSGCFRNTALKEITLPDGLEKIGPTAFFCETYGSSLPQGRPYHIDSDMSVVIIPDTVVEIGSMAFGGREKLKSVKMSKNIKKLDFWVFMDTPWLDSQPDGFICFNKILHYYKGEIPKDVTITIPEGINNISSRAFYSQQNLSKVIIPDGVKWDGDDVFGACTSLQYVRLPQDLTVLPFGTFWGTSSLRHIDLPDSLIEIGRNAFYESGIEQLTIPDKVKNIRENALSHCYRLLSLTIGESVEKISGSVDNFNLREIYNLSSLNITAGSKDNGGIAYYANDVYTSKESKSKIETDESGFVFYNGDQECELLSYDRAKKDLVLPSSYKGRAYILNYAFRKDLNIERLVIPDTITELKERAFTGCINLKEIVLPNSITEIKSGTFESCRALTTIKVSNRLVSLGTSAFYGCNNLETITYDGSESSEKASFPDTLQTVGYAAFGLCEKLSSINFGNGLKSIGGSAFMGCSGIEYIVLPKTVENIGEEVINHRYAYNKIILYYRGTKEEFDQIEIEGLSSSSVWLMEYVMNYVYFYSETEPINDDGTVKDGNYWHYVDGEIVVWTKDDQN